MSFEKDFDAWNEAKKAIHSKAKSKLYHAREIWWCTLGLNIGFEQDGTGVNADRPVLIIRGFSKSVCLVVPLTSSLKKNPYHFSLGEIDGKKSFAIISQIRLVDTKRFVNKIGYLDKPLFEGVIKAVKGLL